MKNLSQIVDVLKRERFRLIPYSESDLQRFEEALQIKLPGVYREFLKAMGGGAGNFLIGSDCFYEDLLTLRGSAEAILQENNFAPLPENSFVFLVHQGYMFAFFELGQGDDPPVYIFSESGVNAYNGKFRYAYESYTEFLNAELKVIGLHDL